MFCTSCGSPLNDAQKFCATCGAKTKFEIVADAESKNSINKENTCKKCHSILKEDSKYCTSCGEPVLGETENNYVKSAEENTTSRAENTDQNIISSSANTKGGAQLKNEESKESEKRPEDNSAPDNSNTKMGSEKMELQTQSTEFHPSSIIATLFWAFVAYKIFLFQGAIQHAEVEGERIIQDGGIWMNFLVELIKTNSKYGLIQSAYENVKLFILLYMISNGLKSILAILFAFNPQLKYLKYLMCVFTADVLLSFLLMSPSGGDYLILSMLLLIPFIIGYLFLTPWKYINPDT